MDWLKTIKAIAPTVATALGGPLAGGVVAAIGAAFGQDKPTLESIGDVIAAGQMKPEQIAELKRIELDLQKHERELGFKYADLEVRDRESAREREAKTGDSTNKVLAFIIVLSFIGTTSAVLAGFAKVDGAMAGALVGYISAKAEQVLAYYFGSTQQSARKTELLAKAPAVVDK